MEYKNFKTELADRIVHLLMEQGPTVQAQVGRDLDLPPATLSREVQKLTKSGLVRLTRIEGINRPVLGLNPEVGYYVGVEYRPEWIRLAVLDFGGRVCATHLRTIQATKPEELLAGVVDFIQTLKIPAGKLLAVSAIDCGVADTRNGISLTSSLFPGWKIVHVVECLESAIKVPVFLTFTASAGLAAVDRIEYGHQFTDMIFLEYGQGIACGIKSDGRILRGHRGMVGEIGHTHVGGDETPCPCGSVGCLEAVASLQSLGRQAGMEGIQVLINAKAEDKLAMRLVDIAFERIGTAMGNLVNILNPQAVVLDPIFHQAGDAALAGLRRAMIRQIMPSHAEQLQILVPQSIDFLKPIGGALLARDEQIGSLLNATPGKKNVIDDRQMK